MDNGITGTLYIKSQSGLFKLLQFICSLSAFVSMMVILPQWVGDVFVYFNIVSLFGMIYSLMMVVLNVANLGSNIGSPKMDTVICIIFSILAFTSASLLSTLFAAVKSDAYRAAIIFEFFAAFAYLGNAITKVMQ